MGRAVHLLFVAIDAACRVLLVALTAVVLTTVFGRYVLNATPRWGEEVALALIVWMSLLAVPLGVRNGWHIRLDIVARAASRLWARRALGAVDLAASTAFGAVLLWHGTELALRNLSNLMPGLGISAFWTYLAAPVSGALILVALAERLARSRIGPSAADPAETPEAAPR